MTRTRWGILITLVLVSSTIPISTDEDLGNYGVKKRPVGQKVVSTTISQVPLAQTSAYRRTGELVPYVKESAKAHGVPEEVLIAILYEEIIHQKPVNVKTFGVAQLGVGELKKQGLPPDATLLENDRLCVWLLAKKLNRLQQETGSLKSAITLHNGYNDYYDSVIKRTNDPKLIEMLRTVTRRTVYLV